MEEKISVAQAAALAGVGEATIRRWCAYKFIRASRIAPERGAWRIDKQDFLIRLGLDTKEA